MTLRMKARPLPSKPSRRRVTPSDPKRHKIRQDDNVRLTKEDKVIMEGMMTGKISTQAYTGEAYLARIRAMTNESA